MGSLIVWISTMKLIVFSALLAMAMPPPGPRLSPSPIVRPKPNPGTMGTTDIIILMLTTGIHTIMSLARDLPIKNPPVAPCPDPDPMLPLMLPPTPTQRLKQRAGTMVIMDGAILTTDTGATIPDTDTTTGVRTLNSFIFLPSIA